MKKLILLFLLLQISRTQAAPTYAYRVSFTNKTASINQGNAANYLSAASLNRRAKFNIALDSTDAPVDSSYINTVMFLTNANRLHNVSKWFNQIVILTQDTSNLVSVRNLPYVNKVKMVGYYPGGWGFASTSPNQISNNKLTPYITEATKVRGSDAYYGASYKQIKYLNADYLHDIGFKGENMNIAVIDMGFYKMDSLAPLLTMNALGHLKDTWNFVRDTQNVYKAGTAILTHGTDVLTTMACFTPGIYVGTAPYANYYCYMTEDYAYESPIEEDNWVSAAERADSIGVQILNTSLGYSRFDSAFWQDTYSYAVQMDGKTTLISKANNMAFAKGIFCVAANGNSGLSAWHYLVAPADADSVYSVGSMDSSGNYNVAVGSSFGPSADGQVKPDGLSVGGKVALIGNNGVVGYTGGSSFAAPTVCGAIACLMQALPNVHIAEIKKLIHQSSSRYATPSDSMGYGIPNFKLAYQSGMALSTQNITMGNQNAYTLYPNPANNTLFVQTNNTANINYEIINAMGTTLLSAKNIAVNNSIDIQNLPVGYYVIRILQNKQMVLKHFVKK